MKQVKSVRRLRVHWHFLLFLLKEFRWPILVFAFLVLVGGGVLKICYKESELDYVQACYAIFMMVFTESVLDFPKNEWYLQPLFFLIPIIGLGAVADSVVRLAYLVFTNKDRLPQWQRLLASLHRSHVVVVGVGRVGYHVARGLVEAGESVVGIDLNDQSPLLREVHDLSVPILQGDGRNRKTLIRAGIENAKAAIFTADDDLVNLDGALTAKDINPRIRVVLRMADDTLASKFAGAFDLPTISTAQVASPPFVAKAAGLKVYQEFPLRGRTLQVADVKVDALAGSTVGDVQLSKKVNIVLHMRGAEETLNPGHEIQLQTGDEILVVAEASHLVEFEQKNEPVQPPETVGDAQREEWNQHIIIIGGGKMGYRIARGLKTLDKDVLVIDEGDDTLAMDEIRELGVPIMHGNARKSRVLIDAGVLRAKALISATSNDLVNLDAALTALDLNPSIRVVLRIFDATLAEKFETAFNMPALSASRESASAFIAAAVGRRLYQEIGMGRQRLHLTDIEIDQTSLLLGKTVGQTQSLYGINIVMHQNSEDDNFNPQHDVLLQAGDTILAIAPLANFSKLNHRRQPFMIRR